MITSRLMVQLSEPAVLLARQMYFPDMLLVRLLSLRVPCLSSAKQPHSYTHTYTQRSYIYVISASGFGTTRKLYRLTLNCYATILPGNYSLLPK